MPGVEKQIFKEIMHFHYMIYKKYSDFTLFNPKLPSLWVDGHEIDNVLSPCPTNAFSLHDLYGHDLTQEPLSRGSRNLQFW